MLSDVGWVMAMKALLAAKRPTIAEAIRLIGPRRNEPTGGIALQPRDTRFSSAYVAPRSNGDEDAVLVHALGFAGTRFTVRPAELTTTLPLFEAGYNTYDGGKFFFFYPLLPNPGALSGIQLYADDNGVRYGNDIDSVCHVVSFRFGSVLERWRDGFSCKDPEDAFGEFARRWFTAFADGRAAEACNWLKEPNSYGIRWTPEAIQALLAKYGARAVTTPEKATGTPHSSLVALADGSSFSFDHNVPLDGAWSDLTAQFEFLRRGNDFAVVLQDLHVL